MIHVHPLNDTRTPPNWYAYTPYLIWFRCFFTKFRRFLTKLEHHARLTCLRLHRENQSARPPKCTIVLNPPPLKLYDSQKLALNNIYEFTKGQGYIVLIFRLKTNKQVPPTVRKLPLGAGAGAGIAAEAYLSKRLRRQGQNLRRTH